MVRISFITTNVTVNFFCIYIKYTTHNIFVLPALNTNQLYLPLSMFIVLLIVAMLLSCLETIRDVVGDTTPDHILTRTVIENDFDCERALNSILSNSKELLNLVS